MLNHFPIKTLLERRLLSSLLSPLITTTTTTVCLGGRDCQTTPGGPDSGFAAELRASMLALTVASLDTAVDCKSYQVMHFYQSTMSSVFDCKKIPLCLSVECQGVSRLFAGSAV